MNRKLRLLVDQVLVDDKPYNVVTVYKGGMGRVWLLERAFDEGFDPIYRHRIAVKTFDFMKDEHAIEKELNIWISLSHPSIVTLKKIGRLNYRLAAIMPLLYGSLEDAINSSGTLSEKDASIILLTIAKGLDYAWATYKILHLDIKPSNILVENISNLSVKIADWGIARISSDQQLLGIKTGNSNINMAGDLTKYSAGTPLYMSPERISGYWSLSPAVDIYSLGMIAIRIKTGILPFSSETLIQMGEIVSGSYYKKAIQLLQNCSGPFRNFCLKCINPNLDERLKSYDELFAKLNTII